MSNDKTGILWLDGHKGRLGIREDGAKLYVGTEELLASSLANVAGEFDQFVPASGKILTLSNTGTIAGGDAWALAIAAAKTFTVSNTITLAGTDSTVMTFPATSATIARTDAANVFTGAQTASSRLTATTVGTAGTLCVAEEHGDGLEHLTKLTCTAFAVGTGGDNADLAIGAVCYTLPSGAIAVLGGSIEGIFDQASHGSITDGEVGLGTVVGSTAVDTIAEVGATSGDVMLGRAIASYTLGTTRVTAAGNPVTAGGVTVIAAGASPRTVFLNLAATWPNIAAPEAVTFTGTVTIRWRIIN